MFGHTAHTCSQLRSCLFQSSKHFLIISPQLHFFLFFSRKCAGCCEQYHKSRVSWQKNMDYNVKGAENEPEYNAQGIQYVHMTHKMCPVYYSLHVQSVVSNFGLSRGLKSLLQTWADERMYIAHTNKAAAVAAESLSPSLCGPFNCLFVSHLKRNTICFRLDLYSLVQTCRLTCSNKTTQC